ncbi:adenylyl-sulfate kinase [Kribbella sp. NBC_01245]|uniref:AAA family ATPase n=1 Tax=Kribbella sp. NBC_01245 TaxID=2903578 RepID=UPI002E2DBF29|nr:AAA family ATPase [Kribbella sp. NBC_01245]
MRMPVLWICGPTGVGKSTVGWQVFADLEQAGIPVAYVDVDQVGMCYPAPADDPHNQRLKVRNIARVVENFRAAGAHCVIVSGTVDASQAHTYADQFVGTSLRFCRLRVGSGELVRRLRERGWDAELQAEALAEAETLDRSDFTDLYVDTDRLSVADVARLARVDLRPQAGHPVEPDQWSAPSGKVLWLCGPTGVGKSAVGFEIFQSLLGSGVPAAYLDLEQIGLSRPVPADDPAGHRIRARNLADLWQSFREAGAERLVVAGPVEDEDALDVYKAELELTLVRLHAEHRQLAERIQLRAEGIGWRAPGDSLAGQPPEVVRQVTANAQRLADDLERNGLGDVRLDTTTLTITEAANLAMRSFVGIRPLTRADKCG